MNGSKLLRDAGLLCYADRVDVDHLRYNGKTRRRANRFAAAQAMLLRAPNDRGVLAGRLVCLDLVRPSDLQAALSAEVYGLRGRPCIDWPAADSDRVERRALSCFTALALTKNVDAEAELSALPALLESLPEYRAVAAEERLAELERDLVCWAAQRLPKPLWAHVAGLRPMSSLARHCAALVDVAGVPRIVLDEPAVARRAEAADMLDTAVAAARKATTPLLVDLAIKVFSVKAKESDANMLARWARELLGLRARVEAGDVASAVIIAWQLDLVESGTLTEVDAAVSTRARYVRVASLRLWRMLAAFPTDIQRWISSEMNAGYLAMMADPTCKDLSGLGAAISSFQAFLQEVFGFATLPIGLHKLIPEPVPRAQWIPETAVRRAIRWIDEDTQGDPRLKQICALMILLAYHAPLRLGELRWLRLSNIANTADGSIEIEITALSGASRLKSPAATRRVLISDAAVVARLAALIARREAEGAPSGALLFAAPDDDTAPYRAHAVHVTLLRLLKQATGDPAMTFYALRHTCVSNAMEELLSSASITNNNRLSQLADWAGHEVAVTTLKFYSHWFEFALRTQIDASLRDHSLSNADGERLLGTKANTLTVMARRKGVPLEACLWQIAEQRAEGVVRGLPTADAGLDLHEPQSISFVGPLNRNFTIFHCFTALSYLMLNVDRRLIQDRMHLSAPNLQSIDVAAVEVARGLYAARGKLLPEGLAGARSVVEHFGFEFARVRQPRYDSFRAALALPQEAAVAAAAANAWSEAWRQGELSADPPERLVPLLAFLKSAGVTPDELLLTYEDDRTKPTGLASLLAAASAVATAVFHDHLPVKALLHVRRGRERAFLVWPSRGDAGEAGRSNAGFDVLMFAVSVWARPEVQEWK